MELLIIGEEISFYHIKIVLKRWKSTTL